MAFPAVEATAVTDGSTAATSHATNLPATVSAGALLIIVGRAAVAGAVAVTGGGWTITQDSSDASDDVTFWMYRNTLAAGTEDGTTITITHGNGKMSAVSFSITGAQDPATQAPQSSSVAVGTDGAPNATTCTPTGGAKDYLWIVMHGADGEHTISTYPYASNNVVASTLAASTPGTNNRTAVCTTTSNAASFDAAAFALSIVANTGWTAWTIAVHPTTAVAHTASPSSTLTLTDSRALGQGKGFADALVMSDTASRTVEFVRTVATDTVALADQATPDLEEGTGNEPFPVEVAMAL